MHSEHPAGSNHTRPGNTGHTSEHLRSQQAQQQHVHYCHHHRLAKTITEQNSEFLSGQALKPGWSVGGSVATRDPRLHLVLTYIMRAKVDWTFMVGFGGLSQVSIWYVGPPAHVDTSGPSWTNSARHLAERCAAPCEPTIGLRLPWGYRGCSEHRA